MNMDVVILLCIAILVYIMLVVYGNKRTLSDTYIDNIPYIQEML
uniref:Uncharacterized protein n=1 Tax=viral metagenome TaxID=1070528 RepID=A0A6C0M0A6_9ZZZZ